ncbi:MAG: DUF177 domain-containing protein [bacterium]|nr:DUF177 domain-containing protein [bacterium]
MIGIDITGMRDGQHNVETSHPVSDITGLGPEYTGTVDITGVVVRRGPKFTVIVTCDANAHLVCDRSLEEYDEPITFDLDLDFVTDSSLASTQRKVPEALDDEAVRAIRDEDNYIDLTEDIRQELTVALPMRRVAPAYRDKNLEEIFPAIAESDKGPSDETADGRWEALKKLKRQ